MNPGTRTALEDFEGMSERERRTPNTFDFAGNRNRGVREHTKCHGQGQAI